MSQLSKGDTFADGQQLTAARLNQLVDSGQLLVGAITEQTAMTANTLEATDAIIVSDSGVLKKATIGDIVNSNLPVATSALTTSAINGSANKDVIVSPNDGANVTGKVFSSSDGITAVVTSVAHGLQTGQVLNVTASNSVYSGVYVVTVLTVDTFSYKVRQDTPTSASGTCSYIKKATELVNGINSTTGNSFIGGSSLIEGSEIIKGNETIDGNLSVAGTLAVKGQASFTLPPKVGTLTILPRTDYFVQTRATPVYTSGWGGYQNLVNIYGTKIPELNLTLTPQKAGNKVVLTWTIFGESTYSANTVYLVTRTPNSGVGAGVPVALPDAVDSLNNTWSGIATNLSATDSSTSSVFTVKIVDFNSLDVSSTYSVHFRAANNRTSTFYLNRTVVNASALDCEQGMSLGHAQEIYT